MSESQETAAGRATLRRFAEIDWDFASQASDSPFSSLHWHPCRFPSQIPALAISRFTVPGDLILEPFLGSATTLVAAQRAGRRSIGIDINPISCLIGSAKTIVESGPTIATLVNRLKLLVIQAWDQASLAPVPPTVQGDKWFMPRTLTALRKIWGIIESLTGNERLIGTACFSASLLPSCREDRHWGYICDNTQPKSVREPDARAIFLANLDRLAAAYHERDVQARNVRSCEIMNGDAKAQLSFLADETIDSVVTSPPYFGVSDYVKAQRLSMEWLSLEIEPVRRQEIGARSKRHRLSAASEYLVEITGTFAEIHRVLKRRAWSVVVFGQSPTRPDIQKDFAANLRELGFSIEFETERQIAIGRRQKPSIAEETIFVLRKQ